MQSYSLAEIRQRTFKHLDSWWTVLLVDPYASRLVRLVAPYRWVTPNRLTLLSAVFGAGAAACFADGGRGPLIGGALLFHLAFVADCVDGKVARLHGTGSMLGAWFGFMLARLRAVGCAAALMGGQYARTGQARYLWLAALVAALELMRYVNAGQMAQIRAVLRDRHRVFEGLRRRRIRMHVVSGIEFEMAVFVVGPLTGWVAGSTLVAGALLVAFEVHLVAALGRSIARAARPQPRALVRQEVIDLPLDGRTAYAG